MMIAVVVMMVVEVVAEMVAEMNEVAEDEIDQDPEVMEEEDVVVEDVIMRHTEQSIQWSSQISPHNLVGPT